MKKKKQNKLVSSINCNGNNQHKILNKIFGCRCPISKWRKQQPHICLQIAQLHSLNVQGTLIACKAHVFWFGASEAVRTILSNYPHSSPPFRQFSRPRSLFLLPSSTAIKQNEKITWCNICRWIRFKCCGLARVKDHYRDLFYSHCSNY